MKIFTVLIISFNNIFTIPANINNEKTTAQLVRNKREDNKIYDFEIKDLQKVKFHFSPSKNYLTQVQVNKIDNNNLNEKLPELRYLNNLSFKFTQELQNNQNKQNNIKQLITTHGQEITEINGSKFWVINKKITIKAQGTNLTNFKESVINNIWDYTLNSTNDFEIETKKESTDIELPTTTTNFDGNHKYSDIIENLDYLMIHRGDFDKFNYSYLYWTPIFNFIGTLEKGYYKEFTIKNHGFKNESYFYHKTSTDLNNINENILKIKAFNKTLIAGNNYLQLLHGEKEIWKYDTANANDYYLIKHLFGTLNYLDVKFSFLRYDPELKNDIYLYFKNNIPSINNSDYKNVFDQIYEILGNFFASLFYATFDMDEKTHTEIYFKGIDNYKKDHFIQIGFFYRSLITFYPKKYLINITGNSELLLRSYFFTFDKKTHQENYNAIKNKNSIYQIEFNVLKSYDNKLITLPTEAINSKINYLNTDIDIRYGINIFTLTFPLYYKGNISNYNFKIYDFNVLNSTAFIPDGSNNSEWNDLIPPANCKYSGRWIPTFNNIGCAIQNAGIKMLNWMLTASQVITILRPLAIIAKATVNFSTVIFPVFKTVPAFYYTFQFLIGFAIFLMILRIFV
ncbi:hypothetical protein [Spiroplasma endosymbiont of Nephrotoma flavescens]|uniref:hypothetical protein n=1 Tax=Spiroplasma endosymbiont of Nephrotoma flavescens TaxID=3066302 RepID=UPI00313CB93E